MPGRQRSAEYREKKNQARRVARARSTTRMTRGDEANPDFRRNAKPGEGISAAERQRERRADPEKRRLDNLRRAERRRELSEDEAAAALEASRGHKKRYNDNLKSAREGGGIDNYSSWLKVYLQRVSEQPQVNAEQIKATIAAFTAQGFRIVKGAVSPAELEAVKQEVAATAANANAGKTWENMFSAVKLEGEINKSDERQMAEMSDDGVSDGVSKSVASALIERYLGSREFCGLQVGRVSLLDTQSSEAQPDHSDYAFGQAAVWKTQFPVGGILAIDEGSLFSTFDCSLDDEDPAGEYTVGRRLEVVLEAGDLVLFHGATVHRGARYLSRNRRVSFHAVPRGFSAPLNKTFPIANQFR